MRTSKPFWGVIAFVCTSAVVAAGQSLRTRNIPQTQQQMHARVMELYGFHPSKLNPPEIQKKSGEMDIFWNEIKASPEITLPLLRAELRDPSSPSFFSFDGSQLLLSLSKTKPDEALVAASVPRVDLPDVQSTSYFYLVHNLACDGIDVTAAALHTLDRPGFSVPVPQHAMVLDQRVTLMYLLLSMDEKLWTRAAEDRFRHEKDEKNKQALLNALYYAQTDDSDRFIAQIASDPSQSPALRKEAQDFEKSSNDLAKSWLPVLGSVNDLRALRRQRLRAVSDEAIGDVEWITRKITQKRAKAAAKAG